MNRFVENIAEDDNIDSKNLDKTNSFLKGTPKNEFINSIVKMQEKNVLTKYRDNTNKTNSYDCTNLEDEKNNEGIKKALETSGTIKNVDLRGFDPDFSKSLYDAVTDAKKDFPDLRISYCGTIQNQVQGIKETISKEYEYELRSLNGNKYSDKLYKQIADNYADDMIKEFGLDEIDGVFAWSLNMPNGKYKEYNGIAINECFASDNDKFNDHKTKEVQAKHKPVGCDTSRATVDHELGHEIDRLVDARNDTYINNLYNEMKENGNSREVLSEYSETSVKEFVAEAYSEYRNNPKPRDYSLKVYERLVYLYSQRRS